METKPCAQKLSGFPLYRRLLQEHFKEYFLSGCLALLGAVPLAVGLGLAVLSSSILVLFPASILGGMLFMPCLACLYDTVLYTLRGAEETSWWARWRHSLWQNARECLAPGAVFGLFTGLYVFMGFLFYWSTVPVSAGTLLWYAAGATIFLLIETLYLPQMVLFAQPIRVRMQNILLFSIQYFWKALGVALLKLLYLVLIVLFMPWSILAVAFLGLWIMVFLPMFLLYPSLNAAFRLEERFPRPKDLEED